MTRKKLLKLVDVKLEISENLLKNYYLNGQETQFKKLSENILISEQLDQINVSNHDLILTEPLIAQPYLCSSAGNNNLLEKTKIIDYFGESDDNYFSNVYQIIYIINEHWDKTLEKYLCRSNRSLVYFPYKNSVHENAIAAIGVWNGNPDFYQSASINEVGKRSFKDLFASFDKCMIFYPE